MRSRNRNLMLISLTVLLLALLAVGLTLMSKTAGFFPMAQSRLEQKPIAPALPEARPFTGSLGPAGKLNLSVPRRNHTATALADGRVLIVGGDNPDGAVGDAELLDPNSTTLVAAVTAWKPPKSLILLRKAFPPPATRC